MLSGTSSFPRKRTGHKLTAIPASYKHVPNGHTRLENVKIKEKAEPGTPIASRFSLGCVDKKDTCKATRILRLKLIRLFLRFDDC